MRFTSPRAFHVSGSVSYRRAGWRGQVDLGSETAVGSWDEVKTWADRLFRDRWEEVCRQWGLDSVEDWEIVVAMREDLS